MVQSQLDSSHPNGAMNITNHSMIEVIEEKQQVELDSDAEDMQELAPQLDYMQEHTVTHVSHVAHVAVGSDYETHRLVVATQTSEEDSKSQQEHGMDWFQLYWRRKRGDYFTSDQMTGYQLREAAEQLEDDISLFWKFRARNTLRLMQLHSTRRQRMLHAFAFQRFKVQTMRLTIHRVLQSRVEAQTQV